MAGWKVRAYLGALGDGRVEGQVHVGLLGDGRWEQIGPGDAPPHGHNLGHQPHKGLQGDQQLPRLRCTGRNACLRLS